MKLLHFNKIVIIYAFFGLSLLSGITCAQSPLDVLQPDTNENQLPNMDELDIQWWQYFETIQVEESFAANVQLFINSLTDTVKDQDAETKQSFEKSISIIKELLNQFQKQKFVVSNQSEPQLPELKESYSIQELIELNTEKNKIIVLLNENNKEINEVNGKIVNSRRQIDQLKIEYYDLTEAKEKYRKGLQWIEKRVRQALDGLRLIRLNIKSTQLNADIQVKNELITQASELVVLKKNNSQPEDPKQLLEEKKKNQLVIDELNLLLTQDFGDSQVEKLNHEINVLDFTLASMENSKYDLLINKNSQINYLEQNLEADSVNVEELRALISSSDELLEQIEDYLEDWQKISQETLLKPLPKSADKPSKEVLKLDERARDKAQKITTESDSIRTIKNDNLFNINLLKIKLEEVETGFSKSWNAIKSFSKSSLQVVGDLIYNPLFTINEYPVSLLPLIKLLFIILFGYLLSKFVSFLIKRYEKKNKIDKTVNRSSLYLMHRLAHYFIFFIVAITGLSTLGINLGNITLIAGALSVGIGFGLQNLVSNFVSGLTIMFEKTLSVGDYIELDNGTTGVIKEIRARSTRLNTNDNIDVIIPNSDMVTNKIINWTLKESIRRVKIPFGVAYGTDKELVKKAAIEAASNVEFALTNMPGKEPDVWLVGFGDSSVDYILLAWVAHYGLRRPNRIRSYFLWELDTALNKYGIEIPFPQRDVHLNLAKPGDKKEISGFIDPDQA